MLTSANSKVRRKRVIKKIKKLFYLKLIPMMILFVGSIYLFNYNDWQVKQILIENNKLKYESKEDILTDIKNKLDEKYFYFFMKSNRYFLPEKEIETLILNKYNGIDKIKIIKNNTQLFISFFEHKEKFYYCYDNEKKCFFVDDDGKIFSEIVDIDDNNKIIFLNNTKYEIGDTLFVTNSQRDSVLDFIKKLKINFNIVIKKVYLSDYEYSFITSDDVELIISDDNNIDFIIEKLKKTIKSGKLKLNKDNEFVKNIKYVNLSFPGRVNYCLIGEVCDIAE